MSARRSKPSRRRRTKQGLSSRRALVRGRINTRKPAQSKSLVPSNKNKKSLYRKALQREKRRK